MFKRVPKSPFPFLSSVLFLSHCTIKCLHCALFNENGTPIEISLDEVYLVTLIYLQLELP